MRELPNALAGMARYRQFIVFKLTPKPKKWEKKPVNPHTGITHDPHDPAIWCSFQEAADAAERLGQNHCVGFVLTKADPFWVVDLDDCLINGAWSEQALQICQMFNGAAIEVSSSGNGLHIFGCGTIPANPSCKPYPNVEFYSSARAMAITGTGAVGNIDTDHTAALAAFLPPNKSASNEIGWTSTAHPDWDGHTDDEELVEHALASQSMAQAFGSKCSFRSLWLADRDELAKHYPPRGNGDYDASDADAALAQHLAFWTGNDCERIERLMRQSALVRNKWEREDYLHRTITFATSRQTAFHRRKSSALAAAPTMAAATPLLELLDACDTPDGLEQIADTIRQQRLSPADFGRLADRWRERFNLLTGSKITRAEAKATLSQRAVDVESVDWARNWVYLTKAEKFFNLDTGEEIGQQAFNNRYARQCPRGQMGGRIPAVTVALDVVGVPCCYRLMYVPPLPAIFEIDGVQYVNGFLAHRLPPAAAEYSRQGCEAIERVIQHLRLLVDRREDLLRTLLDWIAHNVQLPGVKIRYAILIKGIEGDGKTFLTKLLQCALGKGNVKGVSIQELTSDFNAFAGGACIRVMEEIRLSGHNRHDIVNKLKPLISNDDVTMVAKGKDGYDIANMTNYIGYTNFDDSVPMNGNSRRWCVIWTPWNNVPEMEEALGGNAEQYFAELFAAVSANAAEICKWLREWRISPSFNPNGRAPWTDEAGRMSIASRTEMETLLDGMLGESGMTTVFPAVLAGQVTISTDYGSVVTLKDITDALRRLGWVSRGRIWWARKQWSAWTIDYRVTDEEIIGHAAKVLG